MPATGDIALESLEEHHIVKWVLSELDGMEPTDERFDAKVTVLIENVRHHVDEEETEYFPKVRDELGRTALGDLGEAMVAAKAVAPTHAHPRSPNTPPGNLVVGAAAGVVDRVGDTVCGVVQGGVGGRRRPHGDRPPPQEARRRRPTGGKTTRVTAEKIRDGASEATERAIDAVQRAQRTVTATTSAAGRGAAATGRAAKAGAKGTGTSARTGTKRAVTTAKRGTTTTARTAAKAAKRASQAAKRAS